MLYDGQILVGELRMSERFNIEDNNIYEYDMKLTYKEVCNKLNHLDQTRLQKDKEIKKLKDREDKYQQVISGVMAFIELRLNDELWYDWND